MARQPRIAAAGFPHHVIQRGNNRQAVFTDPADYQRYLALVRQIAAERSVTIHAFVLMPNHVHLLVTPSDETALSRFMQALGRRYVRWFNDRHRRTGTLWEGRFRSTVIEADRYLFACMRYIELNPVRAGLCADPSEYRWSSYRHHVGLGVDPMISDHALFWRLGNTPFERQVAYRHLFDTPLANQELAEIRQATNRGFALATAETIGGEKVPGVLLKDARGRGRPRRPSQ
jgi:putative transposase